MNHIFKEFSARTIRVLARILRHRFSLKVRVSGIENVPSQGPVLFAARHYHYLYDGLALVAAIPRRFQILVALDWVHGRTRRFIMECATRMARWPIFIRTDALTAGKDGSIPQEGSAYSINEVGSYRRKGFKDAVDLLFDGAALLVFPEGYPNIDAHYTPKTKLNEIAPFHSGFVTITRLAERRLGKNIPMIPTGISYNFGPSPTAQVRFGPPVYIASFSSRKDLVSCMEKEIAMLSEVTIPIKHE